MTGLRWCDGIACRVVVFDGVSCPGCAAAGYPIQPLAAVALSAPAKELVETKLSRSVLTGAVR